jgi:uncharacterized protein YfaS (alpha-2-macroglobulin family)
LSPLRYLADNGLDELPTALAQAQVGAALALHGDQARATTAFKAALASLQRETAKPRWYGDYGGALRDGAAIVTLAAESKAPGVEPAAVLERVAALQAEANWLSTQEQSWLVLAANAMAPRESTMMLSVDGAAQGETARPFYLRPDAAALEKGTVVKNAGSESIWARASVIGVPAQDLPASSDGFEISRSFFKPDGKPADLAAVRQSDILVVVIKGRHLDSDPHQALIVDLLPAGFEIENQRLAGSRKNSELDWLGELSQPVYQEFRDDRFDAAVDLGENKNEFQLAYLVRAVTPGKYRLPAASVEDMYRPALRARTRMSEVTVLRYQGTSQ